MYNEYEQYALLANESKMFVDNKIHVDLERLDKMSDYLEVEEFISQNYGELNDNGINLAFPQDIEIAIRKEDNAIEIFARQGEYLIFSKGWRQVTTQSED